MKLIKDREGACGVHVQAFSYTEFYHCSCSGGELFTECVIEESFKDKEAEAVRLMRQILEGLVYLHERNIVHLDLKVSMLSYCKLWMSVSIKRVFKPLDESV